VEVRGQYTMDVARRFVAPDSWRWLVHRAKVWGGVGEAVALDTSRSRTRWRKIL